MGGGEPVGVLHPADRNTAEDVVSLTFLEAWRLRDKLLSDAELDDGGGHGAGGRGGSGHGGSGHGGSGHGGEGGVGDASLRAWLFGIATNVLRNTRRAARRHSAALARLPERHAERETVPDFADARGLSGRATVVRAPDGCPDCPAALR